MGNEAEQIWEASLSYSDHSKASFKVRTDINIGRTMRNTIDLKRAE